MSRPRRPPKPTPLAPCFEAMPAALKPLRQWVAWRYYWKEDPKLPDGGKWDKPPFSLAGNLASATDPNTWGDFAAVQAMYKRGQCDGIGFVVTPEDGIFGIDLDDKEGTGKWINERGEPTEAARETLDALNTYAEPSVSGRGLRIFGYGKLPPGPRRVGDVEMYDGGRYFTVTGRRLPQYPADLQDRQAEVTALHARFFPSKADRPRPVAAPAGSRPAAGNGFIGDDTDLLSRATNAKNGAEFAALYAGDTSGYGGDHSRADFALCQMLAFWTQGDGDRIDRLFRASRLYRDKWDERHYANGQTYGQGTIERVIAQCTEFYTPPKPKPERKPRARQAPSAPASEEEPAEPGGDPGAGATDAKAKADAKERKPAAAELLTALLDEDMKAGLLELCLTDRNEVYALLPTDAGNPAAGKQTERITSERFEAYLIQRFRAAFGKMPPKQAVEDAPRYLKAVLYESNKPRRRLCVRIAPADPNAPPEVTPGEVWYDLCDQTGRAIRITRDGWKIEAHSGFRFRRHAPQARQVEPVRGGNLSELRRFLNLPDREPTGDGGNPRWVLLVAWMVAAFFPDIAHPILVVHGRQGSAKSTAVKFPSRLIDPSEIEVRGQPEKDEWTQQADHSYLLTLDNLALIPRWFSDALCTTVTGAGMTKRRLYTNDEDVIYNFRRVVAVTSIEVPMHAPDVLERSILLELEPIKPEARKLETAVLSEFDRCRPALFGALLDTVAATLRELPAIDPESLSLPRMADFARIGEAVERAMGWPAGAFRAAYSENEAGQTQEALDASPLADALMKFKAECENNGPTEDGPLKQAKGLFAGLEWEGTPADLYAALTERFQGRPPKGFPVAVNTLTGALKRIAPTIETAGIAVQSVKSNSLRKIRLTFAPKPAAPTPPKAPTAPANRPAGTAQGRHRGTATEAKGTASTARNAGFERERDGRDGRDGFPANSYVDTESDALTDLEDPFAGEEDDFLRDPFGDEEGGMP